MSGRARVVIIHGAYGDPQENWFPWLAQQVEAAGHQAFLPAFPTPEGQSLTAWLDEFRRSVGEIDTNTILVGHSAGPAFILSLLEQSNVPARATFLVSPFVGNLGIPEFDQVNDTFVNRDFDWARIAKNAGDVFVYYSDNDPYIPRDRGEEIARLLQAKVRIIHNGGHLNAAAGFLDFPQLWTDLAAKLTPTKQ